MKRMLIGVLVPLLLAVSWLGAFLSGVAVGEWWRPKPAETVQPAAEAAPLSEKEKKEQRELFRFLSFDGFDPVAEEDDGERE